jgi:hypothetical protein
MEILLGTKAECTRNLLCNNPKALKCIKKHQNYHCFFFNFFRIFRNITKKFKFIPGLGLVKRKSKVFEQFKSEHSNCYHGDPVK